MRSASAALQDFLRLRQPCWIAELFTLTLADGVTNYLWTSFDQNIMYSGSTWIALGPLIARSRMTVRNTVEVPEVDIKIAALDSVLVNGISLKTAVHNGIFDGARIKIYRVFMPSADASGNPIAPGNTSLGLVTMFAGRLSQAQVTASGVTFTAKGDNVLMNQQAPRNLYQTTCLHTFCDAGCNANGLTPRVNFTTTNTAGFGATTLKVPWGTPPANPALYVLGKITFTSGVCNGQIRTIRNADATNIYLTYPLYGAPQAGDAFSVLMGCARTLNACQNHTDKNGNAVNNQASFRGYPFIPQIEYGF